MKSDRRAAGSAAMRLGELRAGLLRRKQIDTGNLASQLERCLTTFDLTALGKSRCSD